MQQITLICTAEFCEKFSNMGIKFPLKVSEISIVNCVCLSWWWWWCFACYQKKVIRKAEPWFWVDSRKWNNICRSGSERSQHGNVPRTSLFHASNLHLLHRLAMQRFVGLFIAYLLRLCSFAVLDPRVGHTMDVLSPYLCQRIDLYTGRQSKRPQMKIIFTPPPIGKRSIVMSVSVCLSVCLSVFVCPRSYLRNCTSDLHHIFVPVTYGRGSVLLFLHTLCTSGFMDDVIFAHKLTLLDVAAQLKHSAHAALGLAIKCAQ